jgi:hypothetical protein
VRAKEKKKQRIKKKWPSKQKNYPGARKGRKERCEGACARLGLCTGYIYTGGSGWAACSSTIGFLPTHGATMPGRVYNCRFI